MLGLLKTSNSNSLEEVALVFRYISFISKLYFSEANVEYDLWRFYITNKLKYDKIIFYSVKHVIYLINEM